MVMHEPNRLLSKGLVVCLVVGAGWHCGANRGQGEALDAVISVVTTRRPDTTRLLVVIDTASLRAAANLESVAAYELTAQLPPGIVLGIPSIEGACSRRAWLRCQRFVVQSFTVTGQTVLLRALWAEVVPAGRCSGSFQATFELAVSKTAIVSVRDQDEGICGGQ